jgi:hypothetical protein
MALRYDNKYTGEISAVTTKGSAMFQIRAAGEPGKHIVQLNNSTAYAPGAYLNTQQSPQAYIYAHLDNQQEFRFSFDITSDNEIPPDKDRMAGAGAHCRAQCRCAAHHNEQQIGSGSGHVDACFGER